MLSLPLAVLTAAGAVLAPPAAAPPAATVVPGARAVVEGSRWAWPLTPVPVVVRGFDDVGRYAAGHRGVDLAADPGQGVSAPAPGRVTFAGTVAGRGVVVLTHAGGLRTSYEPVDAALPTGEEVTTGEVVATVAAGPAHCPATCLHVGLREGTGPELRYLDPLTRFTRADPPVLLPLGGPG